MRPRIRTIKPEAHTDEDLWDLEQDTGLPIFRVFTGLWNWSDREGRFEWKPRTLKAGVLPYWNGDLAHVLDALVSRGFIVRYVVDGRAYGYVPNFTKHQLINGREEKSVLPPPPDSASDSEDLDASATGEAPEEHGSRTRGRRVGDATRGEGKGTEGNGRERNTGEAPVLAPDLPEPEIQIFDADPTQVFCPPEPLPETVIAIMATKLEVSEAAIRAGLSEFVEYWTIGAGAGRRHSRAKWMANAREDLRHKSKKGKLVEPTTTRDLMNGPGPASAEAVARRERAERRLREETDRKLGITVSGESA